jgi:REP element-mobilizing transposase RayT
MRGQSQLRKGRHSASGQIYHVSTATHDRRPIFSNISCGRNVVRALRREHEAGNIDSLAFVVMPDHLHWLFALSGDKTVSECVRNVKCQSAQLINKSLRRKGTVWQKGFYDRAIRRDDDIVRVARYIIANPWRAGIVDSIRDYTLWDAKWV